MSHHADDQRGRYRAAPASAPSYDLAGQVWQRTGGDDVRDDRQAFESGRALLDELLAEYDDALAAVAEAAADHELGLPCAALGAVQARLDRCSDAVQDALRRLAALGERPFDADHAA